MLNKIEFRLSDRNIKKTTLLTLKFQFFEDSNAQNLTA
jgi:hypothetical protein